MTKTGNIESLSELAASQWGIFTSAQALKLGVSRTQLCRMSNDGRVEPVSYGTYRFTSGGETSRAGMKAAWMSLFPQHTAYERLKDQPYDAVVVGRTAACLHGDTDFYESPYEFAVRGGKRSTRNDVTLHSWTIDEKDIEVIDGLPVTSIERTIADLVRSNDDPSLIKNFVSGVCSRGHIIDGERLENLLAPLAAKYGFAKNDGAAFVEDLLDGLPDQSQVVQAANTMARVLEESPWWANMAGISKAVADVAVPFEGNFTAVGAGGELLDNEAISECVSGFSAIGETFSNLASAGKAMAQSVARLQKELGLIAFMQEPTISSAVAGASQPVCEEAAVSAARVISGVAVPLDMQIDPSFFSMSNDTAPSIGEADVAPSFTTQSPISNIGDADLEV